MHTSFLEACAVFAETGSTVSCVHYAGSNGSVSSRMDQLCPVGIIRISPVVDRIEETHSTQIREAATPPKQILLLFDDHVGVGRVLLAIVSYLVTIVVVLFAWGGGSSHIPKVGTLISGAETRPLLRMSKVGGGRP